MATWISVTTEEKENISTERPSGFIPRTANGRKISLTEERETSNEEYSFYKHGDLGEFMIGRKLLLWLANKAKLIKEEGKAWKFNLDTLKVDITKGQYSIAK